MAGILVAGCHSHDHPHDGGHSHGDHSHGDDAHDHHSEEPHALSYTERTDQMELFVEFPPLVVGQESRFAVHFTDMEDFKAIKEGQARVFLSNKSKELVSDQAEGPSSSGIFRLGLTPTMAGVFDLGFELTNDKISERIEIKKYCCVP